MRKRFQLLVCTVAFSAAAGLCTLPLTAFAADAAVLLPDESAPVVEVVLEPLTPAAEETEPAEPEEREPAAEPAEPETDLPEAPGIALLPAKDAETPVVVPTAAEGTVDIEVSWGAMEFTYTAAWNPSTLAYDPGSWTASGNTVTVTNNGTASATIGFSFTSTAAGVTAAFDQSGGLLAGGSSTTATLTLSGVWTPAEWGTAVSVGTATVTVGAVQSSTPVQSTPAGNTAPSETTGTEPTGTEESDLS